MVVRSLDVNKDPFRPRKINEVFFGPEVPYHSALIYLDGHTMHDISFDVNLARYSSSSTRRYWHRIKHILRNLRENLAIHKSKPSMCLVKICDSTHLSDM